MAHTTTIIGPETTVQGAVTGEGPLSVEGAIHGQVTLAQDLTIEPSGLVNGEVRVREAIVHGRLEGTLIATQRLILSSSAHVTGHIEAPLIRIDDGAHFSGEVEMDLEGAAPAVSSGTTTSRQSFTTPARAASVASTRPAPSSAPTRTVTPPAAPAPSAPAQAATQASPSSTTTTVVVEEEEEVEEQDAMEETDTSTSESNLDPAILAEYDDQTVKELREELRRRDLPVSGTKQELIERLVEDNTP